MQVHPTLVSSGLHSLVCTDLSADWVRHGEALVLLKGTC